jgi:hypothetical protein
MGDGPRMNSKEEAHCFHCRAANHWAYKCPQLSGEQQAQLHMNLKSQAEREEQDPKEGHQLMHVYFVQGGELPDNLAYLDRCSTVMAFKTNHYLRGIKTVSGGIKINCNAGVVVTNKRGTYGRLKEWCLLDRIANIISMQELEKLYCFECNYVFHTPRGKVRFHKEEQGYLTLTLRGQVARWQ